MCCKDKKDFYPILMGLCPKPRDLTHYGQKHDEQGQHKKYCPVSSSPTSALRLLPSRALSSELAKTEYQNIEKIQYYAMFWTDKIVRF